MWACCSVVAGDLLSIGLRPERPAGLGRGVLRFATYTRDVGYGLDYAQQRYYASTWGRFATADPYEASGRPNEPQSWNRYTYTLGGPVNYNDPEGLDIDVTYGSVPAGSCGARFASEVLARTNYGLNAQGAHALFNSKEGVLAIGLFFEVRPNGA
jgi:RHS repeat-associated protein